jgi:hypothetical protein
MTKLRKKWSLPILRYYPDIPGKLKKTFCFDQDQNRTPAKYISDAIVSPALQVDNDPYVLLKIHLNLYDNGSKISMNHKNIH